MKLIYSFEDFFLIHQFKQQAYLIYKILYNFRNQEYKHIFNTYIYRQINMDKSTRRKIDKAFQFQGGERIFLSNKGIQDPQFEYLLSKQTKKIKILQLNDNPMTAQSIYYMNKFKWSNLVSLSLNWNEIGDKGCRYLSKIRMRHIKILGLHQNKISSVGMIHLAKAEWPELQQLKLITNNISVDGLKYLSKARWLNLQKLYLKRNRLNFEELRDIFKWETPQILVLWINENPQSFQCQSNINKILYKFIQKLPNIQSIKLSVNSLKICLSAYN